MRTQALSRSSQQPFTRPQDTARDGWLIGADGAYPRSTPSRLVSPVLPDNGATVTGRALVVNGIMTDVALQRRDLQALANTGLAVVGIHNATEGLARDLWQSLRDKAAMGPNPAVVTARDELLRAIDQGQSLHAVGHSQGALVLSRALREVAATLKARGKSPAQVESALGSIHVETFGGAARRYVDGPKYTHHVNRFDAVPMLFGVGLPRTLRAHPGKGAQVDRFNEVHLPKRPDLSGGVSNAFARFTDQTVHGPVDVYWKHRAAEGF